MESDSVCHVSSVEARQIKTPCNHQKTPSQSLALHKCADERIHFCTYYYCWFCHPRRIDQLTLIGLTPLFYCFVQIKYYIIRDISSYYVYYSNITLTLLCDSLCNNMSNLLVLFSTTSLENIGFS